MPDWRVGAARDLPLGPDRTWDGAAAVARVFAWAGWPDDPDPARARTAFLVYDASASDLRGSYKLPFADVIAGRLTAMPMGVRSCASRLPQTDIPAAVMDRAQAVVDGYMAMMRGEESGKGTTMREYKTGPSFTKQIDGRSVTGIFAVHGNIDDGGDRSHPGLFGDGTVGGRKRAVFLWQHDASAPPTATIDRVFEVERADLPPAVLAYAPAATGGVAVTRTYLDTPRGSEVLAALQAGALAEMSYAYEPVRWDMEDMAGRTIRNLYQADLFDISDVNWGMNPATSADGRKGQPLHIEHATALAAVHAYIDRLTDLAALRAKEGRVLSGENRKRIETAIESLDGAIQALHDLLAATEPKTTTGRAQTRTLLLEWQRLRAAAAALQEHA